MHILHRLTRRLSTHAVAAAAAALTAAALLAPAGAARAGTYVDTTIGGDLKPEDKVKVTDPKPVQLLFQFKTKGADNARGTKFLKAQVVEAAKASGLFSDVVEGPAEGGAIVNIVIDNIPQEGAAAAGFATGLTFGLAGSTVTDFYTCTVDYLPGAGGDKLTRTAKHALHTTIGLKSAPPNGVKAPSIKVAVETMARQVVSHALNDLGGDAAFPGAAPVAPAAPVEAAAPAAAPTEAAPAEAPAPAEAAAPAVAPAPAGQPS